MSNVLTILIVLSAASVLGVLLLGIFSMMRGGAFNEKYGNKLMQARIVLQAVAVALLVLSYFIYHK